MRQLREFGTGAQILKALGIARIKLLTNSPPQALRGIESFQLEIAERAPF
jgi:3,4-dihydroxy 2-butanone 4-phosphate synthase/GTP cyclohydrolase II